MSDMAGSYEPSCSLAVERDDGQVLTCDEYMACLEDPTQETIVSPILYIVADVAWTLIEDNCNNELGLYCMLASGFRADIAMTRVNLQLRPRDASCLCVVLETSSLDDLGFHCLLVGTCSPMERFGFATISKYGCPHVAQIGLLDVPRTRMKTCLV